MVCGGARLQGNCVAWGGFEWQSRRRNRLRARGEFMKRQPAEWAPHAAIWTAWPSDASLWQEDLEPAQAEVAAMVAAIVADGGEPVELLVDGPEAEASARFALADHPSVRIHQRKFGDIWLRDTGPL